MHDPGLDLDGASPLVINLDLLSGSVMKGLPTRLKLIFDRLGLLVLP